MPDLVPVLKRAIEAEIDKIAGDMIGGTMSAAVYEQQRWVVRGLRKAEELIVEAEKRFLDAEEDDPQF